MRRQPVAICATSGPGIAGTGGRHAGGDARLRGVSAYRQTAVPANAGAVRILMAGTARAAGKSRNRIYGGGAGDGGFVGEPAGRGGALPAGVGRYSRVPAEAALVRQQGAAHTRDKGGGLDGVTGFEGGPGAGGGGVRERGGRDLLPAACDGQWQGCGQGARDGAGDGDFAGHDPRRSGSAARRGGRRRGLQGAARAPGARAAGAVAKRDDPGSAGERVRSDPPHGRRTARGAARVRGTEQHFRILRGPARPQAVSPAAEWAESGLRNWKIPDGESAVRRCAALRWVHRVRAGGWGAGDSGNGSGTDGEPG